MRAEIAPGATILDAARAAGATIEAPCAGAGTCGKCRVRVSPDDLSRMRFRPGHRCTEAEESDGWLLACGAEPQADVTVRIPARANEGLRIVS
ncbi:MAG TPA: 2Fe-2S iron-sulfur cluster-binding protein, partial [Candidatus Deferrimicrobiaceae bacterium]